MLNTKTKNHYWRSIKSEYELLLKNAVSDLCNYLKAMLCYVVHQRIQLIVFLNFYIPKDDVCVRKDDE